MLDALKDRGQLLARTIVTGAIVLPSGGTWPGLAVLPPGASALLTFRLLTFLGTLPINITINHTWCTVGSPADGKRLNERRGFIDTFRASATLFVFASALV